MRGTAMRKVGLMAAMSCTTVFVLSMKPEDPPRAVKVWSSPRPKQWAQGSRDRERSFSLNSG